MHMGIKAIQSNMKIHFGYLLFQQVSIRNSDAPPHRGMEVNVMSPLVWILEFVST